MVPSKGAISDRTLGGYPMGGGARSALWKCARLLAYGAANTTPASSPLVAARPGKEASWRTAPSATLPITQRPPRAAMRAEGIRSASSRWAACTMSLHLSQPPQLASPEAAPLHLLDDSGQELPGPLNLLVKSVAHRDEPGGEPTRWRVATLRGEELAKRRSPWPGPQRTGEPPENALSRPEVPGSPGIEGAFVVSGDGGAGRTSKVGSRWHGDL